MEKCFCIYLLSEWCFIIREEKERPGGLGGSEQGDLLINKMENSSRGSDHNLSPTPMDHRDLYILGTENAVDR